MEAYKHIISGHTENTWWIFSNNEGTVFLPGLCKVGSVTISGMDIKEIFTDEQQWIDRLNELEIEIPDYGEE